MASFSDLNLSSALRNAISDLPFDEPTPIQVAAYPEILSGKDLVGIAQTGTGKTFAYLLPLLRGLKFSQQINPRILVLVPTRELVLQVVSQVDLLSKYMSVRARGVYGGTNINTQGQEIAQGVDVLVATPGRLYDMALNRLLQLKSINKVVIDEVDVMLDQGFRFQLKNIFELLPERRQNIMFSATMTEEVDELINDYFVNATKVSIAVSGTPLENITQQSYPVLNFYTKANLLSHLLRDKETFSKVLVFVGSKKSADLLYDHIVPLFGTALGIIHSNKSQNYRIRAVEDFESGAHRVLIATDLIARGLDFDQVSHVINMDVPAYPENYMHRIGRTGRAAQEGASVLFYTSKEIEKKEALEALMSLEIPVLEFPEVVELSHELIPEERPKKKEINSGHRSAQFDEAGAAFHEKKAKNQKENQGGKYREELSKKYKKPRRKVGRKPHKRG